VRGARLQIRELRNPAEFAEASQAAKAAWGFPDLMVPPPPDMITATHSGGMTAGAFEGRRLLGFVHAVPRTNLGRPAIHSHLLAVRPDAQRRGLSVLLKLYQREWCLARGIGLVTWTYDPFMLRNARLNLVRLGAVVPVFLPDFYGKVGGIYGELPSDRFEVHWKLESPAVERAARGETSRVSDEEAAALPVVRSGQPGRRKGSGEMGSVPFSVITENGTDPIPIPLPSARRVLLPFPAGFPEVFRDDLAAGVSARRRFGRTAAVLFAEGFEAVSVVETPRGPAYLLERS
jgi:predicted GNAT superfamily acetyltransferase